MGYSISWLAAKTDDLDRLCDIVGVTPTDASDEWLESEFVGSGLQGGWYLLQAQGCDHPMISTESLSKISTLGEAIACSVEEHVMVSVAESWNRGTRRWCIDHNAQEGVFDLTVSGHPPPHYEEIKLDYITQQRAEGGDDAEVDLIFEIPLQLAKTICGYKHDEDPTLWVPPGPVVFVRPDALDGATLKPWWKFW